MTSEDEFEPANGEAPPWDPFDAVPIVAAGVEARSDSKSWIQLRKHLNPPKGLTSFLAHKFGFKRDVRVNLDERGSWFWRQIDGKTNLRKIERRMRGRFSLSEAESRKATVLFVKMLMLRNMIYLDAQPAHKKAGGR